MQRINRETVSAVVLLLLCGGFFWASFDIPDMGYISLGSEVWPRIILVGLSLLSLIYLLRSLRVAPAAEGTGQVEEATGGAPGIAGFYGTYRNALLSFAAFAAFLIALPYLGMLIGGALFVFVLLGLLGGWDLRSLVRHGAVAVLSVGVMWAIFTFGLRVILPAGEILPAL